MRVEVEGGVPTGLTLEAEYYSAMAFGGPDTAEIRVVGAADAVAQVTGWLRRAVVIRGDAGSVVWSGYVHEVRVGQAGRTVGATMAEMGNQVKILYTTDSADGASESAETGWFYRTNSMSRYGTIERRISAGAALRVDEANRMAEKEVEARGWPALTLSGSAGEGGLLICRGWWHTLDWRYYERLSGRVEFTDTGSNALHVIGWEVSGTDFGFFRQWLHHHGAGLSGLSKGDVVYVSGSSGNNGARTVVNATNDDAVLVSSTTIYFEASDDIRDPASGMGDLRAPGMIYISNGGTNTGWRLIEQALPSYLNVDSAFGGIDTFTPSGTRTIAQGHTIEVDPWNATEAPGASVTISKPSTIAQAWRMPAGESWRLSSVSIRCRRVGVPAAGLTVSIRTNNGGVPAWPPVATATINSAPQEMAWVQVDFDHSFAPTAGALYWIVVSTSSYAGTAYYELEMNDETLAPEGQALVYSGSSWVAAPTGAASLLFRVWGAVAVDVLLREMLLANPFFLTGHVDVAENIGVGVYRAPYASGELTLRDVVEKVLAFGGPNAARLSAWVDGGLVASGTQVVTVREAAAATAQDWRWTAENRLVAAGGGEIERGVLPAGRWVWVDGLPRALEEFGASVFVERAEYDAKSGQLTLTPTQRLNPLRVGQFELG